MSDDERLEHALQEFRLMSSNMADEVAQTYLLGILKMDKPKELEEKWKKESFEKEADFLEANSKLQSIIDKKEADAFLRIAVETTLISRPETKEDFIESVENAGEKMFVFEVAAVAIAAALLIREYYKKARDTEEIIEVYNEKGNLVEKRTKTKFDKNSTLAGLLIKPGARSD